MNSEDTDPDRRTEQIKRLRDNLNRRYPVQQPSRAKRLIKYMSQPERFCLGLLAAAPIAWVNNGHHVTEAAYWSAFGFWMLGWFLLFWLYELHHWAGGKRLD